MASRLLSNALQTNVNLTKQFVRPLATAAKQATATRITNLPNGLTVATDEKSSGPATVGLWIDAGSRQETPKTNGAANLLEQIAVQGQASKFEKIGGLFNAQTGRETTSFSANVLGSKVNETVELLADLVQNTKIDAATVDKQREAVLKQQLAAEYDYDAVVFDHLYAMAFQGSSFSRPVAGIKETVEQLTADDLTTFQKENYSADRMVLVGSGDVKHDELVRLAESKFGSLTASPSPSTLQKPTFTGSEIRIRDDVLPQARIALAIEGAPYLSADYFKLLIMQAVIGAYDRNLGGAPNLSSKLSTVTHGNHLASSFAAFTKGYKDTGLWGMYVVTENKDQIDDFVHFLQKEWNRLSTSVTVAEIERAKQQVKASWLLNNDSTCTVAQEIGTQVLATGKYLDSEELKSTIDKISADDVRKAAYRYIWDQEIAVVGHGPIECLTDYTRVRGNMAYNRF